jgi:predicted dehydrogenase
VSIGLGFIGYGYWGPNMLRNVASTEGLSPVVMCELRRERAAAATRRYPHIAVTDDYRAVIEHPDVAAIVIATPLDSHFEIARAGLRAGKHVLVGKPMTATVDQAMELCDLAAKRSLTLMVDHTFLYHGAVQRMKEIIDAGEIGTPLYFDSVRINLGLVRPDHNVFWDLAPHDLSILLRLIPGDPLEISAVGACHVEHADRPLETIGYLSLRMPGNVLAHVHVNWLSPVKIRHTLIGGSKRMLVYNDLEPDERLKVYDRGIDLEKGDDPYKVLVQYRTGDVYMPKLSTAEALQTEMIHFRDCITFGRQPITDGAHGLQVVRILAAAERSLKSDGRFVTL